MLGQGTSRDVENVVHALICERFELWRAECDSGADPRTLRRVMDFRLRRPMQWDEYHSGKIDNIHNALAFLRGVLSRGYILDLDGRSRTTTYNWYLLFF